MKILPEKEDRRKQQEEIEMKEIENHSGYFCREIPLMDTKLSG